MLSFMRISFASSCLRLARRAFSFVSVVLSISLSTYNRKNSTSGRLLKIFKQGMSPVGSGYEPVICGWQQGTGQGLENPSHGRFSRPGKPLDRTETSSLESEILPSPTSPLNFSPAAASSQIHFHFLIMKKKFIPHLIALPFLRFRGCDRKCPPATTASRP